MLYTFLVKDSLRILKSNQWMHFIISSCLLEPFSSKMMIETWSLRHIWGFLSLDFSTRCGSFLPMSRPKPFYLYSNWSVPKFLNCPMFGPTSDNCYHILLYVSYIGVHSPHPPFKKRVKTHLKSFCKASEEKSDIRVGYTFICWYFDISLAIKLILWNQVSNRIFST